MPAAYSVDLFAGCGGLSLGLRNAGFETLLFSEINASAAETFETNLGGSGVRRIGDVDLLTDDLLHALKREWRRQGKEVDLITGGPPCQGYSGIGHRRTHSVEREEIPSNQLFLRMIEVIEAVEPKLFLFENVRGLLSGRWRADGKKGEIWHDVRSHFRALKDYDIGWKLVHSKDFGVPQNRPRILLVGAHRDLGLSLDDDRASDPTDNSRGLIPDGVVQAPDLQDVLGDLVDPAYLGKDATTKYLHAARSRFQLAVRVDRHGRKLHKGARLTEQEYSRHSDRIRRKFAHMLRTGEIPPKMITRKFAQRVLPKRWGASGPTITATSLPDDFVHYSQPRILTVREWARLQMFPDWFEFRGPRTTGGRRRAGSPSDGVWDREVPKYTQIGNAVPVGLAQAVGAHLKALLGKATTLPSESVARRKNQEVQVHVAGRK